MGAENWLVLVLLRFNPSPFSCTPPSCSPCGWRWWRSADAPPLIGQWSVVPTPPTYLEPPGPCPCRPGGQTHLQWRRSKAVCITCLVSDRLKKRVWGLKPFESFHSHGVSSSGKKVTVAVICLITERISSWMVLMDFSLGALSNTRS